MDTVRLLQPCVFELIAAKQVCARFVRAAVHGMLLVGFGVIFDRQQGIKPPAI